MLKKISVAAAVACGLTLNAGIALAQSVCAINGEPIPCDQWVTQMINLLGPLNIFLIVVALVLVLVGLGFWLKMLFHALMHPVTHKFLWILLMLLPSINFIAAILYYYTAKKDYDRIGIAGPGGDSVILD